MKVFFSSQILIKICLWYFSQRLFGLKTSAAATILSSWIQKSAICACAYLNAPRPYNSKPPPPVRKDNQFRAIISPVYEDSGVNLLAGELYEVLEKNKFVLKLTMNNKLVMILHIFIKKLLNGGIKTIVYARFHKVFWLLLKPF